jgi:hypothetical protein
LSLLVELDVRTELIQEALHIVEATLAAKMGRCTCKRVILWHGYGIDRPDRKKSRFPAHCVDELAGQIREALKDWNVGPDDLAICSGMTESDIVFAETCVELGSRVRIMFREPVGSEVEQTTLWPPLASPAWRERLHRLRVRDRKEKEIWIDTEHLGPIWAGEQSPATVATRRHKEWLLNTAKMEAPQTQRAGDVRAPLTTTTLYGLFLWDEVKEATDPHDSSQLVREVEQFDGYQGEVRLIRLGVGQAKDPVAAVLKT